MKISAQNNFDHIRLFLAIGIFLFHSAELTQITSLQWFRTFVNPAVAVHSFFIVSGFLIFMSYERSSSLRSYFNKRFRRIAPAYITVVMTLFVLLSLLSELTLQEYFTSAQIWKYLLANLSTLNFLQPTLPSLFTNNYLPTVDGSLWTIKVEVAFYLSVPIIVYFYRWFKPTVVLITLFILSVLYIYTMNYLAQHYESNLFAILKYQLPGQMLFFSAGALLYYHQKQFLKYQHLLMLAAVALYIFQFSYATYAVALSVIVIYLATAIPHLGHIAKHGDLSYGLYIWHFPTIQVFITLGLFQQSVWLGFIALSITVILLSWLSWHLIEKPFLSKKPHYVEEEQEK